MRRLIRWGLGLLAALLTSIAVVSFVLLVGIGTEVGSRFSWRLALGWITSDSYR